MLSKSRRLSPTRLHGFSCGSFHVSGDPDRQRAHRQASRYSVFQPGVLQGLQYRSDCLSVPECTEHRRFRAEPPVAMDAGGWQMIDVVPRTTAQGLSLGEGGLLADARWERPRIVQTLHDRSRRIAMQQSRPTPARRSAVLCTCSRPVGMNSPTKYPIPFGERWNLAGEMDCSVPMRDRVDARQSNDQDFGGSAASRNWPRPRERAGPSLLGSHTGRCWRLLPAKRTLTQTAPCSRYVADSFKQIPEKVHHDTQRRAPTSGAAPLLGRQATSHACMGHQYRRLPFRTGAIQHSVVGSHHY